MEHYLLTYHHMNRHIAASLLLLSSVWFSQSAHAKETAPPAVAAATPAKAGLPKNNPAPRTPTDRQALGLPKKIVDLFPEVKPRYYLITRNYGGWERKLSADLSTIPWVRQRRLQVLRQMRKSGAPEAEINRYISENLNVKPISIQKTPVFENDKAKQLAEVLKFPGFRKRMVKERKAQLAEAAGKTR